MTTRQNTAEPTCRCSDRSPSPDAATTTRQNTADPVDTRPRVPWVTACNDCLGHAHPTDRPCSRCKDRGYQRQWITAAQLDALSLRGALTPAELRYLATLDATGDAR